MTGETPTKKRSKAADKPHYVNNKEFSAAVQTYVSVPKEDRGAIPEYIGDCLIKIARGLSCSPNFKDYTYRDEMICDAIENCVRAVGNFRWDATTRSGSPNAFGYFTKICWFAFIRRINLEKKECEARLRYMESAGIDAFADFGDGSDSSAEFIGNGVIERVRSRADAFFKEDIEKLPSVSRRKPRKAAKLADNAIV